LAGSSGTIGNDNAVDFNILYLNFLVRNLHMTFEVNEYLVGMLTQPALSPLQLGDCSPHASTKPTTSGDPYIIPIARKNGRFLREQDNVASGNND
jgi:hypothetical protein